MDDTQAPKIRERVWIEKIDKTYDPPRPVERIFVEDGQIMERTDDFVPEGPTGED